MGVNVASARTRTTHSSWTSFEVRAWSSNDGSNGFTTKSHDKPANPPDPFDHLAKLYIFADKVLARPLTNDMILSNQTLAQDR